MDDNKVCPEEGELRTLFFFPTLLVHPCRWASGLRLSFTRNVELMHLKFPFYLFLFFVCSFVRLFVV